MPINYDNRSFRPVQVSDNGETTSDTLFTYNQNGKILTSTYSGGPILLGHLLGLVAPDGSIELRYHQLNTRGEFMTGICSSRPELMANGKLRLHERWQWTSGDRSEGESIMEEV